MPLRYNQPDDLRRATKDVHTSRRKVREALYRHRPVLTQYEQDALEGVMVVLQGVEKRLSAPPSEAFL